MAQDSPHTNTSGNCAAAQPAGQSIFFQEWLASGKHNSVLSISAVCNNRCLFCTNELNPFPIETGMFRDLEDVKYQLSLMDAHDGPIYMSESVPGRIAEGEAFLHPRLFEILKLVRRKFLSNKLFFTTNGSMLDETFLKELSRFRPMEINLSMHSTQPDHWARIFRRSETAAAKTLDSLQLIKRYHMDLAGSIVTLPKICGWADIEQTFATLVNHGAAHMFLWWPGYAIMTPPEVLGLLECPIGEYLAFADRMRVKHEAAIWLQPDMNLPSRVPVRQILRHTQAGNLRNMGGPYRKVLWLTSEAAFPVLKRGIDSHAPSFPNVHYIGVTKNRTYGGNIICSGLLMVEDFIHAGKEALEKWPDVDLVLVPGTAFDRLCRDLRRTPALRISEELKRPVWVVDAQTGGFQSLLDVSMVRSDETGLKALIETMNVLNRSGEGEASREKVLDLIDAYPVETPWGKLDRADLRERIGREKSDAPGRGTLLHRRFERLDEAHALCIETWATPDQDTRPRWTFLVRRGKDWKIERLAQGGLTSD